MISVLNLTINFGGRFLFDNISFLINPSDKIGLIGRNGTGKSTMMKILSGKEEASSGQIIFPKFFNIEYLPQELAIQSDKTVYDEVYSSLKEIVSLEDRLVFINKEINVRNDYQSKEYIDLIDEMALLNERLRILGSHTIQSDIEQVLIGLGFKRNDFTKLYKEFSGGWQMRIELGKILIKKPDCILLDEPTNHLDIESVRWLEKFLKSYPGSIILISHDRTFLDNITTRTIELINGKIYDMPYKYSDYINAREEQKELELNAFKNQQKQIEKTEKFIERFRYKSTLSTRVQSRIKALERLERIVVEDEDGKSVKIRFPDPPRSARVVVEANHLSKSYGQLLVLNDIDFVLERGDKVAFVGRNGEGKSTLSKIIAGLEDYNGNLKIGNGVIISYFAQQQTSHLDPNSTVFDTIDNAAVGEIRSQVRTLLGAFLFSGDDVYKKVKVLSGGEKSRLALTKLMLQAANLLIMDEPTNHLDMLAKDVLKQTLINYDGTVIVVSHDRDFLDGLTNKTIEFKDHKITEYIGDINEYLDKTDIESLKELEIKQHSNNTTLDKEKSSKIQRELQKAGQKEINKQKKLIEKLEATISELEIKIGEIEIHFSDMDIMSNPVKNKQLQVEYSKLKSDLESIMNDWESESEKLIEMTN
ncbi:MAG TPA: ABC-F family ATP-binding cassette domain-containing protein [Candidatus Kapabacteria bacterium]|nr:ABC-F family ATP-binding cassette domain-containing protein [Candidatus Kapabacteria bacterium]